jgi:hypothetical protein
MLAILQVLEAKHAVSCDVCRTVDAAGRPPTRRPDEDDEKRSPKTSPARRLLSAIGQRWPYLDEPTCFT